MARSRLRGRSTPPPGLRHLCSPPTRPGVSGRRVAGGRWRGAQETARLRDECMSCSTIQGFGDLVHPAPTRKRQARLR
eukprot:442049-Prymnesium_polylepis.1